MDNDDLWAFLLAYLNGDVMRALNALRAIEDAYCQRVKDTQEMLPPSDRIDRLYCLSKNLDAIGLSHPEQYQGTRCAPLG